ncbi:hypothetical protein [Kineococcus sp. SYSU DK018]|uniref:hypothetical protein n=1 Tax=Kineococcus sp. SYSU DK018 TaxID=3383139 RepID=UPI003D7DDCF8
MGPEPGEARLGALAREVARLGADAQDVRARLAGLHGIDWEGVGAAAFRSRLAEVTRGVGAVATGCEEAAGRVAAHRSAVAAVGAATGAGIGSAGGAG